MLMLLELRTVGVRRDFCFLQGARTRAITPAPNHSHYNRRQQQGPKRIFGDNDEMKITGSRMCFAFKTVILVAALACQAAAQPSDIQNLVTAGNLDGMRWPNFSDYSSWLQKFYEPAAYAPAWVQNSQPTPQALALIEVFKDAWKKGLDPEAYDASRWQERIQGLKSSPNAATVARFDVAFTVSTMRYVSDLHIGRINPQHFKFGLSVEQKKYDLAQELRDRIIPATNLAEVLSGVEPPFPVYRRTEQALAQYIELARTDDAQQLPPVTKPIDPGQSYAGVPRLMRLLRLVGDLPADAALSADSTTYAGPLVDAVKRFQRRHGLDSDGRLGPGTIKQMNVPLQDRVLQLQLTLERFRWLPSEFSAPPIIVNIPDFQLRTLDENYNVTMTMRVVVGKSMRTQTPVFSRDMTYVVLRPYWNVPPSILRSEIVPALTRDRGYLAKKRYEVATYDGKVVTDGDVSDEVLAQLRAGKLMVRQRPGPTNALGLVKMMFPNEYNVYLHSTPSQELFSRTRRDFSHGCIRVEKPADLAAWTLRNNAGWTLDRVQQGMQSGKDDVTVSLAKKVPVFIVYGTALAYENGEVHFNDDIYGHDATLAAALAKGYPYP
jgi:murein L,D-transpeptidase YcbB/YkuD